MVVSETGEGCLGVGATNYLGFTVKGGRSQGARSSASRVRMTGRDRTRRKRSWLRSTFGPIRTLRAWRWGSGDWQLTSRQWRASG